MVFYQMSKDPKTPKRALKHIKPLARMFRFHGENEFGYDRHAVRKAIHHVDDRREKGLQKLEKKRKKREKRIKRMAAERWNRRLGKFGAGNAVKMNKKFVG